jgi:hypothetical protein
MHDCRSKRWSGTNRNRTAASCEQPTAVVLETCLLAVLNPTCALLHTVGISAIIIIHHRAVTFHGEKHVALPLTRADVRRRHASIGYRLHLRHMYKYTCDLTIQDCRAIYLRCVLRCSMYVLGSGHSPTHHRSRGPPCLPEQQPVYISTLPR